jgi:hypothetical protein
METIQLALVAPDFSDELEEFIKGHATSSS